MSSRLLDILQLGTPWGTSATFITVQLLKPFFLKTSNPEKRSRSLSRLTLLLSGSITATLLVQSALRVFLALSRDYHTLEDASTVYVLLQGLVWSTLTLLLLTTSLPCWRAYSASALFSALFDVGIILLSSRHVLHNGILDHMNFVLQCFRVLLLSSLSTACIVAFSTAMLDSQQDETQRLLGSQSPLSSSTDVDSGSGVADDDGSDYMEEGSDSDDEDFFSEKQQRNIEVQGGLFNYLCQFTIFWPYIWPTGNRRLQLYLWILCVNTLAERALNVLYPRQFGIVVDKLYTAASMGGPIPLQDILLWIFYELLVLDNCGLPALNELLENRISNWSRSRLTAAAFDHVMGLPMRFHDNKDSGEVIKAVEQASSLNSLLRTLLLETAPFLLDIGVALWYVSVLLDMCATVVVLYVGVAFSFVTYTIALAMRKSRRAFSADARAESRLLYEVISHWSTVSYFNRRKHEQNRLTDAVDAAVNSSQWDTDLSLYLFASQQLCEIVGRLVISILAAYRIALGLTPVGNFVAIESYWDTITMPLWHLGHSFRQLSSDLIDSERLLQLFRETSSIKDGLRTMPAFVTGKITFSHVCFGYSSGQPTIQDLSFTARPGQTVAIVGETGSGKSTILKLLMRFFDTASGSITIDDRDIREVTVASLRDIFGLVPQNAVLFNASVADNVRYGRLDATDEQVHAACRAAAIHDRILGFPRGYGTRVGERGVKLSGGELQRVAIARVALRDPQVVLLDEATSALDTETEAKIQSALRALTRGKTTIVIAHRLSTVMDADVILVMEGGRVIERGTHAELLQLGGKYHEYWVQQTRAIERT